MNLLIRFLALLLYPLVAACHQYGPATVGPGSFSYNEALAESSNQQLLLNLVRLHNQEPPHFLEVSSVVAGYQYSGNLSADPRLSLTGNRSGDALALGGNVGYVERPTISLSPLTGKDFSQRLLTPLQPETLILLARSGWGMETVVLSLVDEINGLGNPGLGTVAADAPFNRLASLLGELHESGALRFQVAPDDEDSLKLLICGITSSNHTSAVSEVRDLLKLPSGQDEFRITRLRKAPNEIGISGRSLLDAMRYLSGGIDNADNPSASPPPNIFSIKSAASSPGDAFVKIKYRDRHYFISHSDRDSKRVLAMLSQLFSLQAASSEGRSPLLTLPQ